ncbi:MAG: TolB family protein, partial [Planctomycetota bacterium]
SEAGLFSIDLFLADANTGETIDKVTNSAVDPHFEALQFILSSGAWHPDSNRFALAGVNRGSPVISIIDVDRKKRVDEYKFDELDEITNPTWSEDERIAFSAMQSGFTDLWLYDIETQETVRLTDDPFADLEPEFSPDGTKIVFVTDRFDSDLGRLDFGNYQLALYDLATGEIEQLPNLEGKNINPSFTPDGRFVLFLSDETGIPNIYRLELETGQIDQLTNVQTGVSGITALSPALSVASRSGKIAYSVYWHGPFRWNIYTAESHEELAAAFEEASRAREEELAEGDFQDAGVYPAILPPEERATDLLALIENPRIGLADALTFDFGDYNPGLSLDFVSQPSLAIGADQFGFFVGAGAQLFFSDMLGNRNLAAAIQVNTSAGSIDKSTLLSLVYENRRGRWNVGGQLSQIPLVSQRSAFGFTEIDGVPAQVFTTERFYQINRQALGFVAYPLNRAQRLEFSGGLQSIDFARDLKTEIFTLGGQKIFDEKVNCDDSELCADSPSTLNLGRAGVALVYDSSIFGGNGPVLGQRYRLDVSPAIGSIAIYNFTFDYRKYFMPVFPFTIAFRGLTTGRYGKDADDPRLSLIYVGWPSLVRGYESNSFSVNECTFPDFDPTRPNTCTEIDDLLGSKVAVFNLEPRLPLLGPLGVLGRGAFPPLDFIAFFDAGVAWTNDLKPSFFGCETEF